MALARLGIWSPCMQLLTKRMTAGTTAGISQLTAGTTAAISQLTAGCLKTAVGQFPPAGLGTSCLFSRGISSQHTVVGTFGDVTAITPEDSVFRLQNSRGEDGMDVNEPLVILFGWAGATPKNLQKYGEIYRKAGCGTLEFILPTRFIFRHTEQVSEVMSDLYRKLLVGPRGEKLRLPAKTLVHCLSDTGVMSFQGFCLAARAEGEVFSPRGIVWDSCPGPRPHVTLPRMVVLTGINWFSRIRDGMSLSQAVTSSYVDFRDLGWKNFVRRAKGLETKISMMEEVWCGHWARDHLPLRVPELFIYSTSDFYIPYKYLEADVIPIRRKLGVDVRVCRLDKSPHVGHLRLHPTVYTQHVQDLLRVCLK